MPARSSATRPKPPLCRTRSVTLRTCSSRCSTAAFFCVPLGSLGLKALVFTTAGTEAPEELPHLTHNNLLKSIPALAPELGSKLSLASIKTQLSGHRVAAASAATSTVVFPEEAAPQI